MRRSFFGSALTAGLIAGALDIAAASIKFYIDRGKDPLPILRYIASGVFGAEASKGGYTMAAWGLLFHFIIAISFAFFFFFLAKQIPSLVKYPIVTGFFYGIFAWCVMRFIIIPYLSRIKQPPFSWKDASINAAILVICVGIPLALLARRYVKVKA